MLRGGLAFFTVDDVVNGVEIDQLFSGEAEVSFGGEDAEHELRHIIAGPVRFRARLGLLECGGELFLGHSGEL